MWGGVRGGPRRGAHPVVSEEAEGGVRVVDGDGLQSGGRRGGRLGADNERGMSRMK